MGVLNEKRCKNNTPNDKMIILSGPGGSGKSTLQQNIASYLGEEMCGNFPMSGEIIYNEGIKSLGFFSGIHEISRSKKNNQAIINLVRYKQSLIADTNHIERVNNKILEHSRVIQMNHVF
jgi:tRNA uridine 5-carbamoylmethylation protein Kti12